MSASWNTIVTNWQGIDKISVFNSHNLIESGGVKESIDRDLHLFSEGTTGEPWINLEATSWTNHYINNGAITPNNSTQLSNPIDVHQYINRTVSIESSVGANVQRIGFFKQDNTFVSSTANISAVIPENAYYVRIVIKNGYSESTKIAVEGSDGNIGIVQRVTNLEDAVYTTDWIREGEFSYEGNSMPSGYGILVEARKYSKLRYILTGESSTINLDYFWYNDDLGYYVRSRIVLTDLIIDGEVHEKTINFDLSNKGTKTCYIQCPQNCKWGQYSSGRPLITNVSSIMGKSSDEDLSVYKNNVRISFIFGCDVASEEGGSSSVNNPWFKGKKYVAFGDSITYGYNVALNYKYPWLIARHFNMEYVNMGVNGSWPVNNLTDDNLAVIDENTMLVTISGGENAWTTDENIDSVDRTNCVGAINYAINYIRSIQPKCVIVLCPTPDTYPGVDEDYVRIANNKHVGLAPITDLHLINWDIDKELSVNILRQDGRHPTEYGSTRMASVCITYINNYIAL